MTRRNPRLPPAAPRTRNPRVPHDAPPRGDALPETLLAQEHWPKNRPVRVMVGGCSMYAEGPTVLLSFDVATQPSSTTTTEYAFTREQLEALLARLERARLHWLADLEDGER
jgi:hypothetical protein